MATKIMSRIFISGSTTGLGLMAGELLASQGHRVVLHARNSDRAEDARRALPKAEAVLVGNVETIAGAKDLPPSGLCRLTTSARFEADDQD